MGDGRLSRRELIRTCSLGALALASRVDLAAAQQERRRTPTQVLGPFYPVIKPADYDADLPLIKGRAFAHRTSTSTCSAGRIGSLPSCTSPASR